MNDNEKDAIAAVSRLKAIAPTNCVAIRVVVTSHAYDVQYEVRMPNELRAENISMRDIHGNWIE